MRLSVYLLSGFLCLSTAMGATAQSILIKAGTIYDGTLADPYVADIRIEGNTITAIGDIPASKEDTIINAQGMIIAPGFIDTHSHHDEDIMNHRDMTAALNQGITTVIVGQDGGMNYPLVDFYQQLTTNPIAINLGSFVGHNTLRTMVMGERYKEVARADDIAAMKRLTREQFDQGALGLSTGLEYEPGIYSKTEEVIELAKIAADYDTLYASHMRSEDRYVYQAIEEIIRIGNEAELPVHISHIKLAMPTLWGEADKAIAMLNEARAKGIDISAEIYPYTHWQSTMQVILPERNLDDRAAIKDALTNILPPEDMLFSTYSLDPSVEGKTLAELAVERHTDPVDLYIKLAKDIERNVGASESIIGRGMDETDIKAFMDWEHTNFCSDGAHSGHPRGYGSFARIMGKYVRNENTMDLTTAIHKATWLPAQRLGLLDRGKIDIGFSADLVMFSPETILDHATFKEPTLLSTGIQKVWVNGQLAWDKKAATSARAGQILKREN